MMDDLNIPPFYIGQKIIAKENYFCIFKKGDEFTVKDIRKCYCGRWEVNVGIKTNFPYFVCGKNPELHGPPDYFYSYYFAPVEKMKFPIIKLAKVTEKAKELISSN